MSERAFYSLEEFPQFKVIQENYPVIVEEFKNSPLWVQWGSDDYDDEGNCMFLHGEWKVCPIYFGLVSGIQMHVPELSFQEIIKLVDSLPEHFPKTTELLKSIEGIHFAAFSRLYANSTLAPHKHVNPHALIYHMGIVIPPGGTCGLKVADQTHTWNEPGEAIIFDDTLEHSAWNNSDQDRVIFYLSFAHNRC